MMFSIILGDIMNSHNAGLYRIILINSHTGQLCSEFNLKNNTQLSGVNGSGKTTTLGLPVLFFGSEPNQVWNGGGSFFERYLPTSESYIIFEYTTASGMIACVLICKVKDKIEYRFISSAFNNDIFIEKRDDDKFYARERKSLLAHLTQSGIEYSRGIGSTREYRRVIQNTEVSNLKEFKHYSLCLGSRTLKNVDIILRHLLVAKFDADQAKKLIGYLLETSSFESNLDLKLDFKLAESWIHDQKSVLALEDNQKQFESIIFNHDSLLLLERELSNGLVGLRSLLTSDKEKLCELTAEIDKREAEDLVQLDKMRATEEEQETVIFNINLEKENIKSRIDNVNQQHSSYQEKNLPKIVTDAKELPRLTQDIADRTVELTNMTAGLSAVEETYKDLHRNAERNYSQNIQVIKDHQTKSKEKNQKAINDSRIRQNSEVSELKRLESKQENEHNLDLNNLDNQITNHQNLPLMVRQSLLDQSATLQKELSVLWDKEREATNQASNTHKILIDLQSERKEKEKVINARLHELTNLLDKKNGCLLSYLDSEKPNWRDTPLNHFLSESILLSRDLDPSIETDDQTIYGLKLNTDSLPVFSVTLEGIESECDQQQDDLDEIEKKLKNLSTESSRCNKALAQVSADLRQAEHAVVLIQNQISQKKEDIASTDAAIQTEREQLQSIRDTQIKELMSEKSKLERKVSDFVNHMRNSLSDIEDKYNKERATLTRLHEEAIKLFDDSTAELTEEYKVQCENLDREESLLIKSKGYDEGVIKARKVELNQLKEKVKRIRQYEQVIRDYQYFLINEYSLQQQRGIELQKLLNTLTNELAKKQKMIAERKSFLLSSGSVIKQMKNETRLCPLII